MPSRTDVGRETILVGALVGAVGHLALFVLAWMPFLSAFALPLLVLLDTPVRYLPSPDSSGLRFDSFAQVTWKMLVYGTVFWGLVGAGIGAAWHRSGRRRQSPPNMPTCCVCGFVWPSPDAVCCPGCGEQTFDPAALDSSVPRCVNCGYRLTGALSGKCPECGTSYHP